MSTLYHYCSAEAAFGILTNREIWASDFMFMNDSQDFRHGVNLVTQAFAKILAGCDPRVRQLADEVVKLLGSDSVCVYIISLSECSDDSAQWSRYARENGIAIGFNQERLKELVQDVFFDFGRVEYDLGRQTTYIEDFVQRLLSTYDAMPLRGDDFERIASTLVRNLAPVLSMFKDASFAAEKEWRTSAFTAAPASLEKFRAKESGIVPYVPISLVVSRGTGIGDLIDTIVIGPGRYREANVSAVARFAKSQKIACTVVSSTSTLRF